MRYGTVPSSVTLVLLVFIQLQNSVSHAGPVSFSNGGYDGVVVSIADNVPAYDCKNILEKLEVRFVPRSVILFVTTKDLKIYSFDTSQSLDARIIFFSVTKYGTVSEIYILIFSEVMAIFIPAAART